MSLGFTDAFEAQIAVENADVNLSYQQFTDTIRAQGEEVEMLSKELGPVRKESIGLKTMEGFALVPPRERKRSSSNLTLLLFFAG